MTPGFTVALAARSSALDFTDLPRDLVELARQAVTDWFGVTIAGSREPAVLALLDVLAPAAEGAATVIGHEERLPPRDAALVNGVSSHVLDFDDVHLLGPCHVTVTVLPAVLAFGEALDADGEELITAYVAGYETACRVSAGVGREPYRRGFHATGTIGTIGAAAACARLLELGAAATARALGIAASEGAGLKCNMGTMTKSLHAGRACEAGLLAAQLAARGFTSSPRAIEADQGFAAISGVAIDAAAATGEPKGGWHLRGNLFKHHAACWFTHSAIEGVRELIAANELPRDRIARVRVHVSEVELGACAIPAPETGLQVKFSIAHLVAMALLGRDTTVIVDEAAVDAEVVAMRERVALVADGAAGKPTRIEIELDGGAVFETAFDVDTPARDLADQRGRLEDKFSALAAPVIGAPGSAGLLALLGELERHPVRQLIRAARGRHAAGGDGARSPRAGIIARPVSAARRAGDR